MESIFVPALNLNILHSHIAECSDKGRSQSRIGQKRDIKVDSTTANRIVVTQFTLGGIFRYVDYQIELFVRKHGFYIQIAFLIGPAYCSGFNAIFC